MPSPNNIPNPTNPGAYARGYAEGLDHGERFANERFFWFGVLVGLVLATVTALLSLHFTGALR